MRKIKTHFDGERIAVPESIKGMPPCEVVVVFGDGDIAAGENAVWVKAQEAALHRIWDNEEDSIYDTL